MAQLGSGDSGPCRNCWRRPCGLPDTGSGQSNRPSTANCDPVICGFLLGVDVHAPSVQTGRPATRQLERARDLFAVFSPMGTAGFCASALFHPGLFDEHRQPRCLSSLSTARQRCRSFWSVYFASAEVWGKHPTIRNAAHGLGYLNPSVSRWVTGSRKRCRRPTKTTF